MSGEAMPGGMGVVILYSVAAAGPAPTAMRAANAAQINSWLSVLIRFSFFLPYADILQPSMPNNDSFPYECSNS
jgi:hypothetical protein